MNTRNLRILILATEGETTLPLIHALAARHTVVCVVIEEKEDRARFLRRRLRRLGWLTVAGQVLFMLLVPPVLRIFSRARSDELMRHYELNGAPDTATPTVRVQSVNSDEVVALVEREHPDAVVVHGTRIISRKVLGASVAPFYNIHAGITPRYRGVHGGYWALVEGEPELFGATVHRVDAGIDTGEPLAYACATPSPSDTFVTYPLLQFGEGLRALLGVLDGTVSPPPTVIAEAPVRYHPTLWGYLATYVRRGVR